MSHRPETTAESFFQAHKDMTVTSKVRSKYTARGSEEPHSDEGCFAATATVQGIRMLLARCLDKRDQGHEAFVADYTQAFLNAEVRKGEQLYAQRPEGWNPKILTDGRSVVWRVRKAMLGLRTSPRRCQEHLSGKLKEHGFVQDERDPCLFVNTELDICIGVHVDDMLAVGPSELTKNLLQELSKDMTMRWSMVTDEPQQFLGRPLCRTPQGYTFGVSCDKVTKLCKDVGFGELKGSNTLSFEKPDDIDTILDESGQRRHRQLIAWSVVVHGVDPRLASFLARVSYHFGLVALTKHRHVARHAGLLKTDVFSVAFDPVTAFICDTDTPFFRLIGILWSVLSFSVNDSCLSNTTLLPPSTIELTDANGLLTSPSNKLHAAHLAFSHDLHLCVAFHPNGTSAACCQFHIFLRFRSDHSLLLDRLHTCGRTRNDREFHDFLHLLHRVHLGLLRFFQDRCQHVELVSSAVRRRHARSLPVLACAH